MNPNPGRDAAPPEYSTRQARKAGVTAFVGTTIEWFDFYIYGTASALVLGRLFFPDASPAVGTLAAFATFAIGFVARPLGGIVFGHFGDKFGRKNAVIITLALMGFGTVGVGCLPTYAQIGIWAPILLVALRVVQGIAMGGEWGGAVLIATEFAPPNKKVLYGAFAQQGSPVGNLLATLAFLALTLMSDSVFESWGWRLPFLASAGLVVVALYIRLRISETPEMKKAVVAQERTRMPLVEVLRSHPVELVLGVGAVVAGVAITYVKTTFALAWATADLGFDRGDFLLVITVALVAQVLVQPFGAVLATRIDPSARGAVDAAPRVRPAAADVPPRADRVDAAGHARHGAGHRAARDVLRGARRHPRPGVPHQRAVHRHLAVVPVVDGDLRRNRPHALPVPAHRTPTRSGRSSPSGSATSCCPSRA